MKLKQKQRKDQVKFRNLEIQQAYIIFKYII